VQDDYQATRKLTFDLGLRYQFISNPMEKHNAESNFNLATKTLDVVAGRNDPLPAYFASLGIPVNRNASRTLVANHHLDFSPRIGFAYKVLPKTEVTGFSGQGMKRGRSAALIWGKICLSTAW
jgi:outer membrane receptor protein involved in Fe transport